MRGLQGLAQVCLRGQAWAGVLSERVLEEVVEAQEVFVGTWAVHGCCIGCTDWAGCAGTGCDLATNRMMVVVVSSGPA